MGDLLALLLVAGMLFAFSAGIVVFCFLLYYLLRPKQSNDENRPSYQRTRPTYQNRTTRLGNRGEDAVKWAIGGCVENEQYVINDVILANGGYTSQIDHIVINPRGIFVIETKNYSGRIYGSENQQEWTQVLAYGREKHRLYNPVKQNATHVYNVRRIVGNLPIYSLVVFVQNNTSYINANNVIPLSALRHTLANGETVLSIQQMKSAYNALISNKADITTEEHIRNVERHRH